MYQYEGDYSWIEQTILDAIECLKLDYLPKSDGDCDFCKYREATKIAENSLDELEEAGYIGPGEGGKPREVLKK